MWSTIFEPSKLLDISRSFSRLLFIFKKLFKCFISPPVLKIQRRKTTFWKLKRRFFHITLIVIYQLLKIENDLQVVSLDSHAYKVKFFQFKIILPKQKMFRYIQDYPVRIRLYSDDCRRLILYISVYS